MENSENAFISIDELKKISASRPTNCTCTLKACAGWESVNDDRWPSEQLSKAGTLREPVSESGSEITFEEYHPNGTRYDSANAPISLRHFPFNRCDVYACKQCRCAVLKYTEFGGYYVDQRVRLVDPELIVDVGVTE
jgi:hypothetical protein